MHVAFLSVDVKGSTLIKIDSSQEKIRTTFEHYHDYVENLIKKNKGLVVSVAGDGIMGQFLSSDDAVGCAFDIQGGMVEFNRTMNLLFFPFILRIGISCGTMATVTVTSKNADLVIDIAAKVQAAGEPGSICITLDTYQDLARFQDYFGYHRFNELIKTEIYINRPVAHWTAWSLGSSAESYNRGFDLLEQASYAEAEEAFREAFTEAEQSGELIRQSACLHGLAYALGRQRKNHEKIRYCLMQIRVEKRLHRTRELETAYRNIYYGYYWTARDFEREGNFSEALRFYRKALVVGGCLRDDRIKKEATRNLDDLTHYLALRTTVPTEDEERPRRPLRQPPASLG